MKATARVIQKVTLLIVLTSPMILISCNCSNQSNKQRITPTQKESRKENTALNIDPVIPLPGMFKTLLKNEPVRVVQYSLRPGEKDDWHTHPPKSSYGVSGGKLRVHLENGETLIADEKTGAASWMDYVGRNCIL